MNILNWSHWRVIQVDESLHDYRIVAEPLAHCSTCVHCGSTHIHRHDTRRQQYMDVPVHGKRTGILVVRRRYQCQSCRRSFFDPLSDMHPDHLMTRRLVHYIEQEALRRTFTSIAEDTGIDEKTVRLIFGVFVAQLNQNAAPLAPQWLGIDELFLGGKARCIFTDLETRRVIDLRKDRAKATVISALQHFRERERIETVCIDMWASYRDAVKIVLPQARIVVDHFHVVKLANSCLEKVRKSIRASLSDSQRKGLMHDRYILLHRNSGLNESQQLILEAWTANFPQLKSAYELKESFFDLWKVESRAQAEATYQTWRKQLPADLVEAFQPLTTAMTNWHKEIFAYFDHRITAGTTEGLNNLLKVRQKLGRGYSFDVLRAQVLLTGGFRVTPRPAYGEAWETGKSPIAR